MLNLSVAHFIITVFSVFLPCAKNWGYKKKKRKIHSSHLGTHASLGETDVYFDVIAAVTTGTKKNYILHDKGGENQFQRRTRIS